MEHDFAQLDVMQKRCSMKEFARYEMKMRTKVCVYPQARSHHPSFTTFFILDSLHPSIVSFLPRCVAPPVSTSMSRGLGSLDHFESDEPTIVVVSQSKFIGEDVVSLSPIDLTAWRSSTIRDRPRKIDAVEDLRSSMFEDAMAMMEESRTDGGEWRATTSATRRRQSATFHGDDDH
ncbi:hypothetical protein SCHPADRAFT_892823 [Schizopora paradoxa]|uniref:Uncharacterized protein n=1 Tax=Schizopora paradoxa TaxID=27342 RepID=A0A0H2RDE0_9AGAM|nr:hypothetical protein SCHPADRAFT_892823 [Schizopora paradoxa]